MAATFGALTCRFGLRRKLREWGDIPRHQLAILEKMGVPMQVVGDGVILPSAELIVDALLGYSLKGVPTGNVANLIHAAKEHGAPTLSLDLPSGLDATTGAVHEPSIRATATLTLALPKESLRAPGARRYVGELYLCDIGVPPDLYGSPALSLSVAPIFTANEIVRLW